MTQLPLLLFCFLETRFRLCLFYNFSHFWLVFASYSNLLAAKSYGTCIHVPIHVIIRAAVANFHLLLFSWLLFLPLFSFGLALLGDVGVRAILWFVLRLNDVHQLLIHLVHLVFLLLFLGRLIFFKIASIHIKHVVWILLLPNFRQVFVRNYFLHGRRLHFFVALD